MDMPPESTLLDRVYTLFESAVAGEGAACRRGCAHCCTRDVVLTTLEGRQIAAYLKAAGRQDLLDRVRRDAGRDRFIPRTTTNRLAALSLAGEDPPLETMSGPGGVCPLLEDELCPIYPVRPLGCRLMASKTPCHEIGCAEIDPLRLTINELFLQVVEHMDAGGFTGNLSDMLLCLAGLPRDGSSPPEGFAADRFVPNAAIPALMVPPEHRSCVMPIIRRLNGILSPA